MPPLRYVTPPDFYQTSNPHQTISVTSQHPAQQLVFPEGVTVHLLNLDANNTVYLGGNQAILAGDLNNTIPLVPGASYISAGNLPVYGICKTGLSALVARSPDAINYFVPAGTSISTGGTLGEDPSTPAIVNQPDNGAGTPLFLTSPSFSPPASTELVVLSSFNNVTTGGTFTISDSGSHTWTQRVKITSGTTVLFIWSTFLTVAPGSMTVTVTDGTGADQPTISLAVRVINNANSNQGSAGSNSAASVSNASITTTQPGSWVYAIMLSGTSGEATVAGTTTIQEVDIGGATGADVYFGRQSSPTGTPGPTTIGWTGGGVAWAALEILHS